MTKIQEHMDMLGRMAKDRVTGFEGVVTSISFDLYGCVQAIVHPGMDKDGKMLDSHWFDVARLRMSNKLVMKPPDFGFGPQAEGKQGTAEKPKFMKV